MRFLLVHKTASYLMVLTGLVALLTSGEVGPLMSLLSLAGLALSWFWEPPRVNLRALQTFWNVLTLVVLAYAVVHVLTGGSLLLAGIDFVVFLSLNKLFNRRESRDYQHLYIVSFLQMVAGTVLNSDLLYGVLFLLYVVFGTWSLILFHLKREMEENYLLKYGDSLEGRPVQVQRVLNSRKLVGFRFLAVTSLVSLAVFAGALLVFFAFPRVGFGFFFRKQRAGITMAGFSDQVELGQHGLIKDDRTVVLRAEFPQGGRDRLPPYWRGIAFDRYDGRRWTKSRIDTCRPRTDRTGRSIVGGAMRFRRGGCKPIGAHTTDEAGLVAQRIYLEPMESQMLFGLRRMERVEIPEPSDPRLGRHDRTAVMLDREGDVQYRQRDQLAFRYTAFSAPERVGIDDQRRPLADYRAALPEAERALYLQLPDRLNPEIARLGAELVGDAATVGEAVARVENHLRTRYGYTLDLKRDERYAPLDDFLFVQRRGHCEYFATAMVILLRTQGIAARNVNGFLGGVWNDYGGYLAVSQGDAHSWVEVWHGEGRWETRDPTPAGAGAAQSPGLLDRLAQYADALRLRWYQYIIEYDLDAQVGALKSMRDAWRARFGRSKDGRLLPPTLLRDLGVALAIGGLLFGLGWVWRQRGRAQGPDGVRSARQVDVARLYSQLVDRYARLGHRRAAHTTAAEFLHQLRAAGAPDLAVAETITGHYTRVRFGGEGIDSPALAQLRRAVRDIGKPHKPA